MRYLIYKSFILMLLMTAGLFNLVYAQKNKNVQQYSREVELPKEKVVKLEITQSAGTLDVRSGASKLMQGQFAYTKTEWKPVIAFTLETGKLVIKQPDKNRTLNMDDGDRNDWKIRLNNKVAMDIELSMGAGEGTFDLQGMKITNLQMKAGAGDFTVKLSNTSIPHLKINAGVGQLKLDLTGKWTNNLTADIKAGIGEINLRLPRYTSVSVKISGLGNVDAPGFKKQDGYYVNDAYNQSTHHITIDINGGMGNVNLEMEK